MNKFPNKENPGNSLDRPSLLMISPVALWPQDMAAKVRILNILKYASQQFDVTFVARCDREDIEENEKRLRVFCKRMLFLFPINRNTFLSRVYYRIRSSLKYYLEGFSKEAYYAGHLNLSKNRLTHELRNEMFDIVLFEYWFTANSVEWFRMKGIPCLLDMHDIMWKKHESSVVTYKKRWKRYWHRLNQKYRELEEKKWHFFDGLITINAEENEYVRSIVQDNKAIIQAGTGVELDLWPYLWDPANPPRVLFYGALGNIENERGALRCIKSIMPRIWEKRPNVEIWFVGANPPRSLVDYARKEHRAKITGFVEDVKEVLATGILALCPLEGKFGFRSRLIEVMAIGVPVIASPDAVYGMELQNGKGIAICNKDEAMAEIALEWIISQKKATEQSLLAREQVNEKYSIDNTYGKINEFLLSFVKIQA